MFARPIVRRLVVALSFAAALVLPATAFAAGPSQDYSEVQNANGDQYVNFIKDNPINAQNLGSIPTIYMRHGAGRETLIRPRVTFIPELLKSIEAV
jgi:hypothetical protein